MTRARRSLSILALGERPPMLQGLDDPSLLVRIPPKYTTEVLACSKIYQSLTLSDIYLDYAGRLSPGHPTLTALEGVVAGDAVRLSRKSDHWFVESTEGVVLGRLAKSYSPPKGADYVNSSVAAVLLRTREECSEDWRPLLRQDEWFIVLPELVFSR
jgi:ATP-dependent DNA helicase RecQ